MDKRQQWAIIAAAVLFAGLLGGLILRQFSGNGNGRGSGDGLMDRVREPAMGDGTFDSGTLSEIPEGEVSVDTVVSGIGADLDAESGLLDAEAEAVTSALSGEDDLLNDFENIYEEDAI